MRIAFLIVLALLVVSGLGGFIYLGAYPPHPPTHSVDRTVPNDQFKTH